MQRTAPKDTGDLIKSLSVSSTVAFNKGRHITRIVSTDPQIKDIIHGTHGPYKHVPAFGPGSPLGGWGIRHGFVTQKSRFFLARKIAHEGTPPAGTFQGKQNWIKESLREAIK